MLTYKHYLLCLFSLIGLFAVTPTRYSCQVTPAEGRVEVKDESQVLTVKTIFPKNPNDLPAAQQNSLLQKIQIFRQLSEQAEVSFQIERSAFVAIPKAYYQDTWVTVSPMISFGTISVLNKSSQNRTLNSTLSPPRIADSENQRSIAERIPLGIASRESAEIERIRSRQPVFNNNREPLGIDSREAMPIERSREREPVFNNNREPMPFIRRDTPDTRFTSTSRFSFGTRPEFRVIFDSWGDRNKYSTKNNLAIISNLKELRDSFQDLPVTDERKKQSEDFFQYLIQQYQNYDVYRYDLRVEFDFSCIEELNAFAIWALEKIHNTNSLTFDLQIKSTPVGASVCYKRSGDKQFKCHFEPTDTILKNLPFAIWKIKADLNGQSQYKTHNAHTRSKDSRFEIFNFTR